MSYGRFRLRLIRRGSSSRTINNNKSSRTAYWLASALVEGGACTLITVQYRFGRISYNAMD